MLIDWLDLHFIFLGGNKIWFCIARVKYNVALTRWYIVRLALITRTGIKHNNICLNKVLRFLFIYIENKGDLLNTHGTFRLLIEVVVLKLYVMLNRINFVLC